MKERLHDYYLRELRFVRELAREFAQKHPGPADRLLLHDGKSTDPHVERLIEAFAYLTANVRTKLDDDFPELTDALLGVLYPHLLAPIPSMMIVQFSPPGGVAKDVVPRHTKMYTESADRDGTRCQYRTSYETPVWTVRVESVDVRVAPFGGEYGPVPPGSRALLRLRLSFPATPIETIAPGPLRLYLKTDELVSADLYELLFTAVTGVVIQAHRNQRPAGSDVPYKPTLFDKPERVIRPVGFSPEEMILEYPPQSFIGYQLLTELFTLPEKYRFFDLDGWDEARANGLAGTAAEVVFFLKRAPAFDKEMIKPDNFLPNCSPAVNLFEKSLEPIPLSRLVYDYRVVPEATAQHAYEVFSITDVYESDPYGGGELQYRPFYSYRHGHHDNGRAFWYASRRPSTLDNATDVYLNLVDLKFDPAQPDPRSVDQLVNVRALCTNRDLPIRLAAAEGHLALELEGSVSDVKVVRPPTPPLRPPLRKFAYWRLVSHLNLNHLSLSDSAEGRDTLQKYLELYDFADPSTAEQQGIAKQAKLMREGVLQVESAAAVDFVGGTELGDVAGGFARGVEIRLLLRAENYPGVGAYLFAAVLDRYFGLYTSINSFTKLVARTPAADQPWKFPARCGARTVV